MSICPFPWNDFTKMASSVQHFNHRPLKYQGTFKHQVVAAIFLVPFFCSNKDKDCCKLPGASTGPQTSAECSSAPICCHKLLHKRQNLSRDPTFREINAPPGNSKNNKKLLPSSKPLGFLNSDKEPEEVVSWTWLARDHKLHSPAYLIYKTRRNTVIPATSIIASERIVIIQHISSQIENGSWSLWYAHISLAFYLYFAEN